MQIVEANAVDKSTGAKDWRDVKKIIDGVLPTLRGRVVVITNLSGSVYLKSQEDKNGRNLDLVKEVNGKEYFQGKELITLSDEDITASTTEKMIFYVVNLYALVKFFERKGYTVSTDKSVFFESDELALKVQERFDCEKLDDRADFKIEFAAKEYLRVGYDDDNDYITELIDISEAYIDGCVGTAYREKDKYNSEEEYKRGCRLATLLQKKVISDMYDVRGTTVSNNTKQDKITQTILDKLANVG